MQLNQDPVNHGHEIKAYTPGEIKVDDQTFTENILLSPHQAVRTWVPVNLQNLDEATLEALAESNPKVIILGCGQSMTLPPQSVYTFFYQRNIGLEVMTTYAACRTYNVLAAEGRDVLAALIV